MKKQTDFYRRRAQKAEKKMDKQFQEIMRLDRQRRIHEEKEMNIQTKLDEAARKYANAFNATFTNRKRKMKASDVKRYLTKKEIMTGFNSKGVLLYPR